MGEATYGVLLDNIGLVVLEVAEGEEDDVALVDPDLGERGQRARFGSRFSGSSESRPPSTHPA